MNKDEHLSKLGEIIRLLEEAKDYSYEIEDFNLADALISIADTLRIDVKEMEDNYGN